MSENGSWIKPELEIRPNILRVMSKTDVVEAYAQISRLGSGNSMNGKLG